MNHKDEIAYITEKKKNQAECLKYDMETASGSWVKINAWKHIPEFI